MRICRSQEIHLDYQECFASDIRIGEEALPLTSDLQPEVIGGSASHIISKFSPLHELPIEELSYIYMLDSREDRLFAFKLLVARRVERAHPWVDVSGAEAEARLEAQFARLEAAVAPRLPGLQGLPALLPPPQRRQRLLRQALRALRRRPLPPPPPPAHASCDGGALKRSGGRRGEWEEKKKKRHEEKDGDCGALCTTPARINARAAPDKPPKVPAGSLKVLRALQVEELQEIFAAEAPEQRWRLFCAALRLQRTPRQKGRKAHVEPEEPEGVFEAEVRPLFQEVERWVRRALEAGGERDRGRRLKEALGRLRHAAGWRCWRGQSPRAPNPRLLAERAEERARLAKMERISEKVGRARVRVVEVSACQPLPALPPKQRRSPAPAPAPAPPTATPRGRPRPRRRRTPLPPIALHAKPFCT